MRRYKQALAGGTVRINVLEGADDISAFRDWWMSPTGRIGLDTETSGLDIYSPGWELRLVQFGDSHTGWVLRVDQFADVIRACLRDQRKQFTVHNFGFDGLVLDKGLGVTIEEMAPRVLDSQIVAKLIDPRGKQEGGVGAHLKDLAKHYVDPAASDGQSELYKEFHKIGETKDTGWAKIAIDNPAYEEYAGLDPILTVRVAGKLDPMLDTYRVRHLLNFEHEVQRILMQQQRRGVLVDVDYTRQLSDELLTEAASYGKAANEMGVANINSTKQLADRLLEMGADIPERTASGKVQVNADVLRRLAGMDKDWNVVSSTGNPLARAVLRSKRAAKWGTAYADAFLNLRDADDRLHPSIQSMAARTARMSISNPPLQQLPSGDWKIRRSLVADPGNVIISCDYTQQELVTLAAVSQDERLLEAVRSGADMHDFATEHVYGPRSAHASDEEWTKHRKICKAVSLGRVYGGGAATIQRQTGAPMDGVRRAIDAYDTAFPGIKALSYRLQEETRNGELPLITATGRRLMLDPDRVYACVNYQCQSVSRDITAEALIRIDAAGLGDKVIFSIHDEILAQAGAGEAEEVGKEIEKAMSFEALGVPYRAEAEIGGRSWGSLYGAEE